MKKNKKLQKMVGPVLLVGLLHYEKVPAASSKVTLSHVITGLEVIITMSDTWYMVVIQQCPRSVILSM